MRETQVRSLGQEDPLEKAMAPHSSALAWKIPWTEEHGRLQSMGSQRVGHDNWLVKVGHCSSEKVLINLWASVLHHQESAVPSSHSWKQYFYPVFPSTGGTSTRCLKPSPLLDSAGCQAPSASSFKLTRHVLILLKDTDLTYVCSFYNVEKS